MPYKNSEKRKEKSRDAARCRRSKETETFLELSKEIPVYTGSQNQLDKASIMRLAISHLKMRKIMGQCEEEKEDCLANLYPKAMEGFLILISSDGDIIYASENIIKYLGITQVDFMGQSIYDFAHQCDYDEVSNIFSKHRGKKENSSNEAQNFFMRMKCTLTSKGKNVNLKSASYKVLRFYGKMIQDDAKMKNNDETSLYPYLVLIGEPIPHPSNIEIPLDGKTFLTRHNMDMTFTYCDERMKDLLGYDSEELIDQSLYCYHHALDSGTIDKAYRDLFAKGQTMTEQYRFLAKGGGYVWMVTQGTVITNTRTQKPQCVVCVHYVISDVENAGVIVSEVQHVKREIEQITQTSNRSESLTPTRVDEVKPVLENLTRGKPLMERKGNTGRLRPISDIGLKNAELEFGFKLSTEDVFTNYSDISSQDISFFKQQRDEMLQLKNGQESDESVDLTHLAPATGDVCIPLPCSLPVYLKNPVPERVLDMKQEPDAIPKPLCKKQQTNHMTSNPDLLPSNSVVMSSLNSPEDFEILMNQTSDVPMEDMDILTNISPSSIPDQDVEIDMDMRAPYIPMNADADFTLLPPTTDALFDLNSDFNPGFFGRTEYVFAAKDRILPEPPKEQRTTLRDMLGESTAVAAIEQIPETRMQQMKRPLDMNSLEKGPPTKAIRKVDNNGQSLNKGLSTKFQNSVLMNLLMNGEDRSTGYSVKEKMPYRQSVSSDSGLTKSNGSTSLPYITSQDIEANMTANIFDGLLLQGNDLMQALESLLPRSSRM